MSRAAAAMPMPPPIVYPETDGEPMAENTVQYRWIVTLRENLDRLLPGALVIADCFWYPVEGEPGIRSAPDVLVAFGRPKGERPSYRTWDEGGVVPQVVFELWSLSNRFDDRIARLAFFDRHGVEEFYGYDPDHNEFSAFVRGDHSLEPVAVGEAWRSPRLGVSFHPGDAELVVRGPDGAAFRTVSQVLDAEEEARGRAEAAEAGREAAEAGRAVAEAKAAALAAKLAALGIDPDAG